MARTEIISAAFESDKPIRAVVADLVDDQSSVALPRLVAYRSLDELQRFKRIGYCPFAQVQEVELQYCDQDVFALFSSFKLSNASPQNWRPDPTLLQQLTLVKTWKFAQHYDSPGLRRAILHQLAMNWATNQWEIDCDALAHIVQYSGLESPLLSFYIGLLVDKIDDASFWDPFRAEMTAQIGLRFTALLLDKITANLGAPLPPSDHNVAMERSRRHHSSVVPPDANRCNSKRKGKSKQAKKSTFSIQRSEAPYTSASHFGNDENEKKLHERERNTEIVGNRMEWNLTRPYSTDL